MSQKSTLSRLFNWARWSKEENLMDYPSRCLSAEGLYNDGGVVKGLPIDEEDAADIDAIIAKQPTFDKKAVIATFIDHPSCSTVEIAIKLGTPVDNLNEAMKRIIVAIENNT